MSSFYISAAHKSSGKTTVSIGLTAAIRSRGLSIRAFKKGPDYIDPMWLSLASGLACHNLDFYTSSRDHIHQQFNRLSADNQAIMVEGNMGLYDGLSLDGSDSNAAMAKHLGLPVILVIDCAGTSRGIAPLLNGYQQFDPDIRFAGVIMNKLAGSRHEQKLREMVEAYTDFEILGAIPRDSTIQMTERHLGLIPSNEVAAQSQFAIQQLEHTVNQHVDVDRILELPRVDTAKVADISSQHDDTIRIAIARDSAFGFYYPGDLQRFSELGVELITFDTMKDHRLPDDIDGLFIGGGFPETHLPELSANHALHQSIKNAIELGLPAYAECGGLMYLCKEQITEEQRYPLCNIIPASVRMNQRPQGRGYVELQTSHYHPWYPDRDHAATQLHAHEFHYSAIEGMPNTFQYAYTLKRGTGIDGLNDGIVINNLLASYTHLRQTDQCDWVDRFVSFVKRCKRNTRYD